MEDYYTWMHKQNAPTATDAVAMDARKLPPGVTLADHKKVCTAKPGECPYEAHNDKAEEADNLTGGTQPAGAKPTSAKAPSQEEMYDIYEAEGVSPRLIDGIKAFHADVLDGKTKPMRMPTDAFRGSGVPMWMLGAYYVASNYPDDETATRVLTDFAKRAGAFVGDTLEYCTKNYGESIGGGMESTVFDAGDSVVKASSLGLGSEEVMQKVERIMLGNQYFPDTKNQVLGIGNDPVGGLSFVLKQPFVQFDKSEPMTDEEVAAWAKEQGFEMRDSFLHNCTSPGNDLACMDMHNENVVRTNDGKIVCIDPCVIPNVYELELRGFYDYDDPPDRFE